MRSYYLKGYYNGDTRNCRNYSNTTQNTICHYVIFRADDCGSLIDNSSSDYELYQDSAYNTRYDIVSRPSINNINVTSSNCSTIVNAYGGFYENYAPYLVGNVIGFGVFTLAFFLLIGSIIRRHL